jgi:hypothetical protein
MPIIRVDSLWPYKTIKKLTKFGNKNQMSMILQLHSSYFSNLQKEESICQLVRMTMLLTVSLIAEITSKKFLI